MKNIPTFQLVVAGALQAPDGRWLMHKRPAHKQHGGLWEFPGGKVEQGETPQNALVRELSEELGIRIDAKSLQARAFADGTAESANSPIVLLLYTVGRWTGEPQALEGGTLAWFTPAEIDHLDKPELDVILARHLFAAIDG